jgi:DnaJ-class molecular chaperone
MSGHVCPPDCEECRESLDALLACITEPCEMCRGTGEVEGKMPNRYDPDYLDDVPLVCGECEGTGTLTTEQP